MRNALRVLLVVAVAVVIGAAVIYAWEHRTGRYQAHALDDDGGLFVVIDTTTGKGVVYKNSRISPDLIYIPTSYVHGGETRR